MTFYEGINGEKGVRLSLLWLLGVKVFKCFLNELQSYPASTFQHLLDFCRQVELMSSSDGKPCCVDFL